MKLPLLRDLKWETFTEVVDKHTNIDVYTCNRSWPNPYTGAEYSVYMTYFKDNGKKMRRCRSRDNYYILNVKSLEIISGALTYKKVIADLERLLLSPCP